MKHISSESIFSPLILTMKQAFAVSKNPLPWMKGTTMDKIWKYNFTKMIHLFREVNK